MPRFNIHHITRYRYEAPVRDSANKITLFPIKDSYQEVIRHDMQITGEPPVETYKDYYGNEVGTFTYAEPHSELVIDSRLEISVKSRPDPEDDGTIKDQWQHLHDIKYEVAYIDFIKHEQFAGIEEVKQVSAIYESLNTTPLQAAKTLNEYVYETFTYNKGVTDVETTLDEIWKLKAGVCQDFAHMLLAMLRMINIPARYVSGYICPKQNGMRGEGATHAWVEAYIPFYGWLGLDPTNNCIANDLHVRLAIGRNFSDVSPVKGTFKGVSGQILEVGVTVSYEDGSRREEPLAVLTPQPTKPLEKDTNSYRRHLEMIQQQQ
jgi:transglutaminase-like putative cysteine protease